MKRYEIMGQKRMIATITLPKNYQYANLKCYIFEV